MSGEPTSFNERESEEQQEAADIRGDLIDNVNDMVQSVRTDGSFLYTNRAWRMIMGYSAEEIRGLSLARIIHPDCMQQCTEMFQRALAGERPDHIEAKFVTKDGRAITVYGSVNCRFESGKPVATRGVFRDVTERKLMEEALRKADAELGAALGQVKLLEGILPICSFCKRIRDENNVWCGLESYIADHSEANFSHTFCPDCGRRHYGKYLTEKHEA